MSQEISGQYNARIDPRLMQNAQTAIDKQRNIDVALDKLEQRISALNQIISQLESKLAPYLQAESPSKAVSAGGPTPSLSSRVVNKIESFAYDIDNARTFLYSLIERID